MAGREGDEEDEMVGWHHRFNGHVFEQALGDSQGQRRLECCSPWSRKELDTTEQLNKYYIKINGEIKKQKTAITDMSLLIYRLLIST